ncbi:hypothetical protein ABH935_000568 [Catenulispora sp. GAS73]|uniref:hypothetical protein n=1 Tax=Catenulispora sp. GAS73 TaxID=3156269 RepID=UPI0035188D18
MTGSNHSPSSDAGLLRTWLALVLAEGSGVAEDEARFLDRSATRAWIVEQRVSA